jgi:hypothetical protein
MEILWDIKKNELLKELRGVSFEEIVVAVESDEIIDFFVHPDESKYPNQVIFLVFIRDYIYAVPAAISTDEIFLKTIYPSRKYTKVYLGK